MAITTQLTTLEGSKKPVTSTVKPSATNNVSWVTSLSTLYTNAITAIISAMTDLQSQIDTKTGTTIELSVGSISLPSQTSLHLTSTNTTISHDLSVDTITIPSGNSTVLQVENLTIENTGGGSYTPTFLSVSTPSYEVTQTSDTVVVLDSGVTSITFDDEVTFVDGKQIKLINLTGNDIPIAQPVNNVLYINSTITGASNGSLGSMLTCSLADKGSMEITVIPNYFYLEGNIATIAVNS
jgi:hypothetical protein